MSKMKILFVSVFMCLTLWWDGGGGGSGGIMSVQANEIESCTLIQFPTLHLWDKTLQNHTNNHHEMSSTTAGIDPYSKSHSSSSSSDITNHFHQPPQQNVQQQQQHQSEIKKIDEEFVLCQLRTLNSELEFENLTSHLSVPIDKIHSLRLVCNDVLFFESILTPEQLAGFTELYELSIEKCKIKYIPSESFLEFEHLKTLRINTGNSDWAARSLEISIGAFENVPSLQSLDLGFNHMWSLPERLLCQLESLQTLNLTHNLLSDIEDIGLPRAPSFLPSTLDNNPSSNSKEFSFSSCLGELQSFDLSHNSLRNLGRRRLERLKRLRDLRLEYNWLEEFDDDTFFGLNSLKILNMSSNRLGILPSKLFQPCKSLQNLDLRNNSLSTLSPGLLVGLERLVQLDLSQNLLSSQWINVEAFRGLVRLVILDLSHNQLTHLTPSTFHDLYALQVLGLEDNLISSIADSTFSPLKNLHTLNLGRNKLVTITAGMFDGLYVLHKLILDSNQLTTLEPESMRNCTSLSDLSLIGNQLTVVPPALRGLQLLRTLDLGENRISSLTNESFLGMSQLYGLRIVDNKLEEIPKGLCDPITHLRVFNSAQNKINKISNSAFVSCPELRVLRLDSNSLENLPPSLSPQLPKLLWLNVSENRIRRVDYSILPSSLEWFDISYNQLEFLGGAWADSSGSITKIPTVRNKLSHRNKIHNPRLRVVDATHNKLTHLDFHSVPPALEKLGLNHNRINKLSPDTFSRSPHLRRVELVGNQLENIPLTALRLPQIPSGKSHPEFLLGGNPFICDCEMEWLMRIDSQLRTSRQYPIVSDIDSIVCRLSYSRSQSFLPFPDMKAKNFLCPYTDHCFQTCQCCEFDACDCSMTCPSNCTCYHEDTWTANVVDCASSNHFSIPNRLPMDSTEVYLDGNSISILKSHSFIGRKNLKTVFLNSSGIETISNKSFNGLHSLEILHLEKNRLKSLHGYEFDHLKKLRELYLHDNLIGTISNSTFLPLKSLEILRLDGNRLVVFTVWQLSLNSYLVEIGLGRNEWNCDCEFLHQLYGWVSDNSKKIVDLGQVRCYWNTTHEPGPHLLDYNTTCGTSWALIQGGFDKFDFIVSLPLIMGLASVVLLIILTTTFVFWCRERARIWFYSNCGLRFCSTEYDSNKIYDSYFIYSQKDEEFITQTIAEELETHENYRLCLHYRDLISESGDLQGMMINAMENSKILVLFLSRNFFQGEWASGESRTAFLSLLKSNSNKLPPNAVSIVVLFIEEVPELEISSEFLSWMKNNKRRYTQLRYMDKNFWKKFKYSLPDPTCHYHSNITSHTTTSSASSSDRTCSMMKYYTGEIPCSPERVSHYQKRSFNENEHHGGGNLINSQYWSYVPNGPIPPTKYTTGTPGILTTLTRNQVLSNYEGSEGQNSDSIPSFLFQPNHNSPVPIANFSKENPNTGESSYLNYEGEHVYSTLDPPSPTKKIQLPNGYTYSPAPQIPKQWYPLPPPKLINPSNTDSGTSSKSKQNKFNSMSKGSNNSGNTNTNCSGSNNVPTYLV